MATPARASAGSADELVWLQRALFVLVRPREILGLLRDDSEAAARARSEAVLALVWLAGIAAVLWTPSYGRLQQDVANDNLNVAVIAFIGGGLYGALAYFVGGFVVYGLTRVRGGVTYRQARHVLAFAAAPLAASLFLVFPVRLAVYGDDIFKRGGADHGAGNAAFIAIELAIVAWSLALLVLGVRMLMRREPLLERA
jgi:hypothetical protein